MKQPLLTDSEYKNFVLDHRAGGNGFAVVEDLPGHPEYCRVAFVSQVPKASVGNQAFVAWRPLLSKSVVQKEGETPAPIAIGDELMALLLPLRQQLLSGELKVVNTRFVSTQTK